ncbi:FtsX-like permease family protein, partial [Streptomyces sp. URMC 126]|uniref:FtsX-like permease family protein n=1 Tax=Streptomyces sp. URMC 126 TaxID=3423401 RepID=UPI003F1AE8DC
MLSLALATLRARRAAFAGAFLALALGTAVIAMTALALAATFGTPHPGPQRFAAAPAVVVPADPRGDPAHLPTALPDRTVERIAATGAVTADRTFDVTLAAAASRGAAPGARAAVGHGWSAAGFGRYRLVAGRAPAGDGEVVVGGGEAELVGRSVSVGTADGVRRYTVAGVTAPVWFEDAVFFTDRTAARLSPPVNALVATGPPDRLRAAAGAGALVRTGDGRVDADPDPSGGAAALANAQAMAGTTMVIAASVAVVIVIATFAFAVDQRRRELALLRLVGATPRQVRRTVLAEAAVLGVVASAVGCAVGVCSAGALGAWMTDHEVAPRWFTIGVEPVAPACAFVLGVATALLGAASAALRAARVRPAEAMREAAASRRALTPLRVLLGVGMLAGAVVAGWVISRQAPETAVNPRKYGMVPLLFAGGCALVAPLVLPAVARLVTRPWVRRGAGGLLVRQNLLNARRRAAAAVVPSAVAVGLAATMLCAQSAGDRARVAQARAETRADRVVLPVGGKRLDRPTMEALHGVPGVSVVPVTPVRAYVARRSGEVLDSLSAQAVAPAALGDMLRPTAVAGSLAAFGDDSLVIDRKAADGNGLAAGERVVVRLPDGVPHELRIAAVVRTGLAGDTAYVSSALVGRDALPDRALLTYRPGADRAAVADRLAAALDGHPARAGTVGEWFAAVERGLREKASTAASVTLGISVGYALISVANTLVMATAGRRREFAALGLAGAAPARIVRMAGAEALVAVGV